MARLLQAREAGSLDGARGSCGQAGQPLLMEEPIGTLRAEHESLLHRFPRGGTDGRS